MKLGYLLELILALAVGLAWAHNWTDTAWMVRVSSPELFIWFLSKPTCTFLSGVIVVEALGLWIEKARGRGPRPWGVGRIMWSTLGIVWLGAWGWITIGSVLGENTPWPMHSLPFWALVRHIALEPVEIVAWVPPAVFITSRLAGLPRDPQPDGREWAGRIFGSITFFNYILLQIYIRYHFGVLQALWKR